MEFGYHSTTTAEGWEAWTGRNLAVRDDALELATEDRVDGRDLQFDAVDVATDPDGTIFALRSSGDIWKYDEEREFAAQVWLNDDELADPRAIAVAGDRIYLVGDDPDLVVVSDRDGELVGRVEAGLTAPVALVEGSHRIYVLDRGEGDGTGRVVVFRGRDNVDTALRGLDAPRDFAVDSSGTVSVLELADDGPVISVFESRYVDSPKAFPYSLTIADFAVPDADETLIPTCLAALGSREFILHGRLSESGDPATYHYRMAAEGSGSFEPRIGFDVLCSQLVLSPRSGRGRYPTYYAVADEGDDVYLLEERKQYQRSGGRPPYTATALRRFDAGVRDTAWHRVTLGFDSLPSSTQVAVSYYASNGSRVTEEGVTAIDDVTENDAADLREAGVTGLWDLLERPPAAVAAVVRGATEERAADWRAEALRLVDAADDWTAVRNPNPGDALLREADGRYLHVRLELVGDVDTSPRIGSFRAYCPRRSYLRYLPEAYRGDGRNARFLERFLSIFESAHVDIEEELETITRYFDPEGVSSEYLPWLAAWLAIEHDQGWPEAARREFLARASDLFKKRGTREGMRAYLEIYLSHIEAPDTSWVADWERDRIEARREEGWLDDDAAARALTDVEERFGGSASDHFLFFLEHSGLDRLESPDTVQPYAMHMRGSRSFVVFAGPFVRQDHRETVDRIVANEKPAHVDGNVVELRQNCKLKGNSFLGINTTLTPREFTLGRATLGGDTVLVERDELS